MKGTKRKPMEASAMTLMAHSKTHQLPRLVLNAVVMLCDAGKRHNSLVLIARVEKVQSSNHRLELCVALPRRIDLPGAVLQ